MVLIKIRCLLGYQVKLIMYSTHSCNTLGYSSLCHCHYLLPLKVVSLRPRLSIYVDMSATSTLHSYIVTLLIDVLNYCRTQTIGSSYYHSLFRAELCNDVSPVASLRLLTAVLSFCRLLNL